MNSLADYMSPEATLAYSLIVPAVGALLGLIVAGVSDFIGRRRRARRLARERAAKWKGVVS